jgi:hypothetical protein
LLTSLFTVLAFLTELRSYCPDLFLTELDLTVLIHVLLKSLLL